MYNEKWGMKKHNSKIHKFKELIISYLVKDDYSLSILHYPLITFYRYAPTIFREQSNPLLIASIL